LAVVVYVTETVFETDKF